MSPSSTSMRSPPRRAATSRARSAILGSTSAATQISSSARRSESTRRLPMKPGNPVKKTSRSAMRAGILRDLAQLARLHLVHEAAHGLRVRDEGAVLDPRHGVADAVLELRERVEREAGLLADGLHELAPEVVVAWRL